MRTAWIAAAVSLALAGGAQSAPVKAGFLTLDGLQVRSAPAGVPTTAAYLTIRNGGKSADRLLSVECACAAAAMMHRSDNKAGVASMAMLTSIDLPAGGKVAFTPGGLHVMLVGVHGPLKAGGIQMMTLTFEKAGPVKAAFAVTDVIR
jgi:copper(I)-binding protein